MVGSNVCRVAVCLSLVAVAGVPPAQAREESDAGPIAAVRVSAASFNPSVGQRVELSYRLEADAAVTVQVYDPDDGRVRLLVGSEERRAGEHVEVWDGRDDDGRVVADEAYYFVIETASGAVYDPKTFSGGEVGDLVEVELDRDAGTISYRLPAAARVLCRLGVRNGPMLKTLVDWKPRVAGAITEYWRGWDEDRVIRFWDDPGFSGLIVHVALPETTVIAFGNRDTTYRESKLAGGMDRPLKPARDRRSAAADRLRPDGLVPPAWARSPVVRLELPDAGEDEVPEVGDHVRVRVEVEPADLERLEDDRYEIIFYVDNLFVAEAERGYTPHNWIWETHQLPPGEHVLTVNLSSFRGQVGVASRRVLVRGRE